MIFRSTTNFKPFYCLRASYFYSLVSDRLDSLTCCARVLAMSALSQYIDTANITCIKENRKISCQQALHLRDIEIRHERDIEYVKGEARWRGEERKGELSTPLTCTISRSSFRWTLEAITFLCIPLHLLFSEPVYNSSSISNVQYTDLHVYQIHPFEITLDN